MSRKRESPKRCEFFRAEEEMKGRKKEGGGRERRTRGLSGFRRSIDWELEDDWGRWGVVSCTYVVFRKERK